MSVTPTPHEHSMWNCDVCNVGYCVLCHDGCPNCIFKRRLREMAGKQGAAMTGSGHAPCEINTVCPTCGSAFCGSCFPQGCVFCSGAIQNNPPISDGTLTAIRAIAAHVTDSRLAMAAIRVLLEEK